MDLKEIFEKQKELQSYLGNPMGTGEQAVKENMLALIVEATEVLNEINWKPWKETAFEVDRQKALTEHIDVLQFLVNSMAALGFTEEDLAKALRAKWSINFERKDNGY